MTAPPAPQALGGFTLVERIGKGGMGEVWRAERVSAGTVRRRAAVKRILPEFHGDALLRDRFLAEARITARLEHPNIVQLFDFGDQPELYIVMEYVEGLSLAELMRRAALGRGILPAAATMFIIAEAATGLDYAHRRNDEAGRALGIVHRDVSPPNVLVSLDGAVKVGDFGIARAADNLHRTQAGVALGKLVYMAPEQARGETVDRRADVFALGLVLWEALTLRPLVPRESPAAALAAFEKCEFPAPSSIVRGLPSAVDDVVREALRRDPAERTQSAAKMAKALRSALHALAPGFDSRELSQVVLQLAPDLASRASIEPLTPARPSLVAQSAPAVARETPEPAPRHAPQPALPRTAEMNGQPAPAHGSAVARSPPAPRVPPTQEMGASVPVPALSSAAANAALAGVPRAGSSARAAPVAPSKSKVAVALTVAVLLLAGSVAALLYFVFPEALQQLGIPVPSDAQSEAETPRTTPAAPVAPAQGTGPRVPQAPAPVNFPRPQLPF